MASNYERDKASYMRYIKENTSKVVVNLRKEEKEQWQHIAAESGMPLATLIRKLMSEYAATKHID